MKDFYVFFNVHMVVGSFWNEMAKQSRAEHIIINDPLKLKK